MAEYSTVEVRLYPNNDQRVQLNKTIGCARKIWNLMLGEAEEHYKKTGKHRLLTPAAFKDAHSYLKEVDSLALANRQLELNKAFKNFFKNKGHFGKTSFKSKHKSRWSYKTNRVGTNLVHSECYVKLPKLGYVPCRGGFVPEGGVLKSATIVRERDGRYYAKLHYQIEREPVAPVAPQRTLGLDYASNGLYVDSEGSKASMPRYYQDSQRKLAREQRKLSRKKRGGANYEKQKVAVAKVHAKIKNQRKDFLHKQSTSIAKMYDLVAVEDLNLVALANKGFGNGKATMGNAYGRLVFYLSYKLARRGKTLVKVDRFYPSSQLCYSCGERQKMPLSERTYRCPHCGYIENRDINAAKNIEREGLRLALVT